MMRGQPLLDIKGLRREFPAGDETITVLKDIDLEIHAGEMIAIVGASGSGKSTLLNILGCLDRPTQGSYKVAGRETGDMGPDALADLRREHFGFIFQRYHLLPDLSAINNVEIPAIYAGMRHEARQERAKELLDRLGVGDRTGHRPGQLSGGQQQRVSIARALMNGGDVILADEPTGALDRHTGQDVIGILKALNREGHTVIIVTHDMQVAGHADRIIEISDGEIIADRQQGDADAGARTSLAEAAPARSPDSWQAQRDRFAEAGKMALRAMASHRLRTFLTMLGIIIGIASVVVVVALGAGARERILTDLASLGTNAIDIFPGRGFGDERTGSIETLVPGDAKALEQQVYVDSATPRVSASATARYRNVTAKVSISGVGDQEFRVRSMKIVSGKPFGADSVARLSQDVVIDENTRNKFFGKDVDPLGMPIFFGRVPAVVVGVAEAKQSPFVDNQNLNVWMPYTTVMKRILGQSHLEVITVRVGDGMPLDVAEKSINAFMERRHGNKDFYAVNANSMRQTVERATATMTFLVSAIALISLVVGGIGVMNIMLVSVTERTNEIGIRVAVGARRIDIMRQFLIEAVLVCLFGGVLGIALAFALGALFSELSGRVAMLADGGIKMVYSNTSIVVAVGVSTLIGLIFGFLPARNAARLNPIAALAQE